MQAKMNTLVRIAIAIAFLVSALTTSAATYYISPTGDDGNSGTSQAQPWRTIARVMQHIYQIQPGDQILFERGGTYPGKLEINVSGSSASPIVVGAYGTGDLPVISGGERVTNWVPHEGNIWRAPFSTAPKYVFVNNTPMKLARYPNQGWLRNVSGSTTQINSPSLGQANGHWTGGAVIVRTTNWSYDRSMITSSSNGQINFEPVHVDLANDDWGFFLEGKLSELDMAGEWCHDAATGQLYLWMPDGSDPNGHMIHASIHDKGVVAAWQRTHIRIQDLKLQGQTSRAISIEGANNVIVTNCTIQHAFNGVVSSGDNNQFTNNTIHHTFGSGMNIYDSNALIENNVFTDIAIEPGMGENMWGYWGLNATGQGTTVRGNRLTNIGYIGMDLKGNTLVEKNVVLNATSILNDGAGISFDNADGMVIRDNIVLDMTGDLESVATSHISYYPICFGIYFGNTSIKNTTVQRNTVARCNGAGIHVDHTMVSSGNQVKDNVLFDNNVQMSLSDFSNYNGPGATQPYHVPAYNGVYSGNVLYSVRPSQLCLRQFHVYSPNPVDFGSFSNNKYFNPYNELSLMIMNSQGGTTKYYTLEGWQAISNEDAGSTRSPLRLSEFEVVNVLGSNQITNGNFDYNVSGWAGWPTQAQVTQDATYLDNGAMKVNFNDNTSYDTFFLNQVAMVDLHNDDYYRLNFSLQSNMQGTLTAEVKNQSQLQTPYPMYRRTIPFSNERRDMSIIFKSTVSEPAQIQFNNHFTESRYWIDNIRLEKVEVQQVDPYERHILLYNDQNTSQSFGLDGCWSLVNGTTVSESITLPAFGSVVLQKETDETCALTTAVDEGIAQKASAGIFHPNPVKAGSSLWLQEPFTTDRHMSLIDVNGREVIGRQMDAGTREFKVSSGLPPGIYLLRAISANGSTDQRIVVE